MRFGLLAAAFRRVFVRPRVLCYSATSRLAAASHRVSSASLLDLRFSSSAFGFRCVFAGPALLFFSVCQPFGSPVCLSFRYNYVHWCSFNSINSTCNCKLEQEIQQRCALGRKGCLLLLWRYVGVSRLPLMATMLYWVLTPVVEICWCLQVGSVVDYALLTYLPQGRHDFGTAKVVCTSLYGTRSALPNRRRKGHNYACFIVLRKVRDVQLGHSRFEIGLPCAAYHDNAFRFRLGCVMLFPAKESGHSIFGHNATSIREMQLAYAFILKMKGSKVAIYFQKTSAKQSSNTVLVCLPSAKVETFFFHLDTFLGCITV